MANTFGFDGSVAVSPLRTGGNELYALSGTFSPTVGFTHFNGQPVPPLVRLTRTGSLDPGFRFTAGFVPGSPIAPRQTAVETSMLSIR